jgi:rfaE bifunctional protein kinase chain/domain
MPSQSVQDLAVQDLARRLSADVSGKENILVVGDAMIDEYLICRSNRLSPEAPVPVAVPEKTLYRPGGAAHVASQIAAFGHQVVLVTDIGAQGGDLLYDTVQEQGVITAFFDSGKPETTRKTRIVVNDQQTVRIDHEKVHMVRFVHWMTYCHERWNRVVFSDYRKGMFPPATLAALRQVATGGAFGDAILCANAKPASLRGFAEFCHIVTLNRAEAREFCPDASDDNLAKMIAMNIERAAPLVVVTLGDQGVVAAQRSADGVVGYQAAAPPVEVRDITGAGDVFVAALALAHDRKYTRYGVMSGGYKVALHSAPDQVCVNNELDVACQIAALSVKHPGSVVISREELKNHLV